MLEQTLNILLASTYGLGLKSHLYHWNVKGLNFSQLHDFYEELYDELYKSVDDIAEVMRTRGVFPSGTFTEYSELSHVPEDTEAVTDPNDQLTRLAEANTGIIGLLRGGIETANEEDAPDVEDFLVERLRAHKKHGWMIRAHLNQEQR